jgi:hypothetical protein
MDQTENQQRVPQAWDGVERRSGRDRRLGTVATATDVVATDSHMLEAEMLTAPVRTAPVRTEPLLPAMPAHERHRVPGNVVTVLMRCPETGEAVSTGVEMEVETFKYAEFSDETLDVCPACGKTHFWGKADVFLEGA